MGGRGREVGEEGRVEGGGGVGEEGIESEEGGDTSYNNLVSHSSTH